MRSGFARPVYFFVPKRGFVKARQTSRASRGAGAGPTGAVFYGKDPGEKLATVKCSASTTFTVTVHALPS